MLAVVPSLTPTLSQWERELIALTSKLAQFIPSLSGRGVNGPNFEIGTICPLSLRERVRVRVKPHQATAVAPPASTTSSKLFTQTPTCNCAPGGPIKDPATGGTAAGFWETATGIWSGPTTQLEVGSNPFQPPPGIYTSAHAWVAPGISEGPMVFK
jgi:hypothetical protein